MEKDPLVSIIINNYNYGRFLSEAIDSALAQTYKNMEVIVVDDGSTDNSKEIIGRYGDKIIPVLKENGGQGSAFNAGFKTCKGAYVYFLDADDMVLPFAAEYIVKAFSATKAIKVHWQLQVINEKSFLTGELLPADVPPDGNLEDKVLSEGPFYDWYFTPPTSGNAWKRDFLQKVLPMPERAFRIGADEYLLTLAPVYGEIQTLKDQLSCYRIHGNNNCFANNFDEGSINSSKVRFEACCTALHEHFEKSGIRSSIAGWKKKNFNYLWLERLQMAREDVEPIIPAGSTLILIDGNELGKNFTKTYNIKPFMEKNRVFWGLPGDDGDALQELERQQKLGADFIVFWWTSFWWIKQYPQFYKYLHNSFACVLNNDRLIAFNLKRKPVK